MNAENNSSVENDGDGEVEGVDNPGDFGLGGYPLDAVFVRTEQRTVNEVVDRINKKRYVLDPDFQRDFVWEIKRQSKLIESCIMRIPLPVFYVAEDQEGRIIVVDGLQRLTTFARFLAGDFRLAGLESSENAERHQLEGKSFNDLPIKLQERVVDTQLTMYILDAKAPERARLDIFERVNSGETLTRQQMRNALYNGPATRWLKSAAALSIFKMATGNSLNAKKMRDREAINRFVAFWLLGFESYRSGDMDEFLAKGLRKLAELEDIERDRLLERFKGAMSLNFKLFGQHAFRKSLGSSHPSAARSVINISLFEVSAVWFCKELDQVKDVDYEGSRMAVVKLLKDPDFDRSITYSTNSTAAVGVRFKKFQEELLGVLI